MRNRLPLSQQTTDHLHKIRAFEAIEVMTLFGCSKDILEVGAGDGYQSSVFASSGHRVKAVDISPSTSDPNYMSHSEYRKNRYHPVDDYDGTHLPFPDNTFDIIYSSSLLEHVTHKEDLLSEMKRVLKCSGIMIHVLPNARWRILSSATHFYRRFSLGMPFQMPPRHGELGNHLTEIYYFSDYWWSRYFERLGLRVCEKRTNKLVYTGESILDSNLSVNNRKKLATFLGGTCTIYKLEVVFR